MLDRVAARAPWAIIGYSKELESAWKHQRQTMVEDVLARKG